MSRHSISSSRIIRYLHYCGTFKVASQRDLKERKAMERKGYVLDDRPDVPRSTPTREELISSLEERGYRGIILSVPKRKYRDSPRLNPHQHVSVYYSSIENKFGSFEQSAAG